MTRNFASGRGSFQTNRSTNRFSASGGRTTSSFNGNLNFRGQTQLLEILAIPETINKHQQLCQENATEVKETQVITSTKVFLKNWNNPTSNKFVLNVVSGIRLQFTSPRNQLCIPKAIDFCENEKFCIDKEIHTLLKKGPIRRVDLIPNQFVSNIFTRPKRSGGLRALINITILNRYLKKIHFKMKYIMTILPLIKRDMCMTSLDLKDAYFSLPIAKSSRKYLRFLWQGQLHEYQCLCIGLSLAPFYFTKIMKPIFSQLRRERISCTYYVDNSLYLDNSTKNYRVIHLEKHLQLQDSS